MLCPKKTKYRKQQKGRIGGIQTNTAQLSFGRFGLKALQDTKIGDKTIEACRRVITRKLKRTGQTWITIFPDIPVTSKPAEVRMGKGKGSLAYWACRINKGQILFEFDGIKQSLVQQAVKAASYKLPIKVEFVGNQ